MVTCISLVLGSSGQKFDESKLEPTPTPPALTKLMIYSEDSSKLIVPLNLVKTWQFHTQFGKEFSEWLDGFVAAGHAVSVEEPVKNDVPPGRKRGAANAKLETESPFKKQKTDKSHIISMQDITEALILEGKIKDEVMMKLRAQHKVYIVNKGKKEASLTVSDQLIGFGKGGFKLVKGNASDQQVVFKLDGPDTPVIFNNVCTSLQKVLLAQREKDPDVKVCYHKLQWDEADPKIFTITLTHMISFNPNEAAKENTASNMATKEPVTVLEQRGHPGGVVCPVEPEGLVASEAGRVPQGRAEPDV